MLNSRLLAIAALGLAAPPGLAGCPTGADMAEGIVLAQNTPFFMRGDFKTTPGGFSEIRIVRRDGQLRESLALYRHGLVKTGEQTAAGQVDITYVDDLEPVDSLPERGTATISGIARGPRGAAPVELELNFVGHGKAALAECAFDTWTVTSTLRDGDGDGTALQVEYAPKLGLVLAAGLLGPDGTITPAYAYQWAGTAADVAR